MSEHALCFRAGRAAHARIVRDGFDPAAVTVMVGASGGAKWLVLSQLDRVLLELLRGRESPLTLIGSSIGAWRFACYAQADPLAALERLEHHYIHQTYSAAPTVDEISAASRHILRQVLGDGGAAQIVSHPFMRLNVVTARCRGPLRSERASTLMPLLGLSALANAASRRSLGLFFERVVFSDARQDAVTAPYGRDSIATRLVPLDQHNVEPAVLASGSIPMVLAGVSDIPGAPPGMYRDGGVIDYHFDSALASDGLVLYPHFYGHLAPGWFDKMWPYRRAGRAMTENVLLMYPSPAFISSLPRGRIPDRSDFRTLPEAERIASWNATIDACQRLADEFLQVLQDGLEPHRVQRWED